MTQSETKPVMPSWPDGLSLNFDGAIAEVTLTAATVAIRYRRKSWRACEICTLAENRY